MKQFKCAGKGVGLALLVGVMLVNLTGCNAGIERKDPMSTQEIDKKIKDIQNNPQMSEMAKKMTIQSLENQKKNNAGGPGQPAVKP